MTETKKFEIQKDGTLHVTIKTDGEIFLPIDQKDPKKNMKLGKMNQITYQIIDKDKIPVLQKFFNDKINTFKEQQKGMQMNLDNLKDVNVDQIPEQMIQHMKKAIDKGSKATKKEMLILNQYLQKLEQKKTTIKSLDYVKKELEGWSKEREELEKALKPK